MGELKIYIQDNGVYGMYMCVASSKEAAFQIMEDKHQHCCPIVELPKIEESEIREGLYFVNFGDQ